MTLRWICVALLGIVSATSVAVGPSRRALATSGPRGLSQSELAATVTGLWEVRTGIFRGPWAVTLEQTGKVISGTIQQSFPVICAAEPVPIQNGALEASEAGDVISFDVAALGGGAVTFRGIVAQARDTISFSLTGAGQPAVSVTTHPDSFIADGSGFVSPDGQTRFVAHRVDLTTASRPGCRIPDPQPIAAESPEIRRYVATAGIGFPPWTFDLTILNGLITGSANQGRTDSATRMAAGVVGPFPITNGHTDGMAIDFDIVLGDGARIASFHGTRSGAQAITFSRKMTVVSVLGGADPGPTGIFGPQGATHFTAVLEPTVGPPTVTGAVSNGTAGDDLITFDSVDTTYAVVGGAQPADSGRRLEQSGFVLARYSVGVAFGGRLLLTVFNALGGVVRQVEVTASHGDHVALWNLRADANVTTDVPPAATSKRELEVAEARAILGRDLVSLVTDDPDEAARLLVRLGTLLAGPTASSGEGPSVGPGSYYCRLSRIDNGAVTALANLPVEVRGGRFP